MPSRNLIASSAFRDFLPLQMCAAAVAAVWLSPVITCTCACGVFAKIVLQTHMRLCLFCQGAATGSRSAATRTYSSFCYLASVNLCAGTRNPRACTRMCAPLSPCCCAKMHSGRYEQALQRCCMHALMLCPLALCVRQCATVWACVCTSVCMCMHICMHACMHAGARLLIWCGPE